MRRLLLCLSMVTFATSMFLPPLTLDGRDVLSINVVLLGGFGVMYGETRWYANLLYVAALVMVGMHGRLHSLTTCVAGIALIWSLSCIIWPVRLMQDTSVVAASLSVGAYMWMAAMALGLASALAPERAKRSPKDTDSIEPG